MVSKGVKIGMGSSDDLFDIMTKPADFPIEEKKIVLLTVSSYLFRLIVMVYFSDDLPTREHFARLNRIDADKMDEKSLIDAICECGNMIVGTLNRDLATVFSSVGMSTPNIIDKNCASYFSSLNFGYSRDFQITINNEKTFFLTIGVTEFADIDFVLDATVEEATGELEMF